MVKKSRKSLGRSQWQRIIEEWEVSGFSKAAFCEQHNITLSVFYKWLHQLKKPSLADQDNQEQAATKTQNAAKPEPPTLNPDFIPVYLTKRKEQERALLMQTDSVAFELTFARGHCLRVYGAMDWQHLSHLIASLMREGDVPR